MAPCSFDKSAGASCPFISTQDPSWGLWRGCNPPFTRPKTKQAAAKRRGRNITEQDIVTALSQLAADLRSLKAVVDRHEQEHISRRGVEDPRGERGLTGEKGDKGEKGEPGNRGPVYEPSIVEQLENKIFDAKAVASARLALGDYAGADQALKVAEDAQKQLAAQSI